jgi:hypothetical protein
LAAGSQIEVIISHVCTHTLTYTHTLENEEVIRINTQIAKMSFSQIKFCGETPCMYVWKVGRCKRIPSNARFILLPKTHFCDLCVYSYYFLIFECVCVCQSVRANVWNNYLYLWPSCQFLIIIIAHVVHMRKILENLYERKWKEKKHVDTRQKCLPDFLYKWKMKRQKPSCRFYWQRL